DAGSHMHNGSAREVERGETSAERGVQQTTFTPHHMSHGIVNQEGPKHHEKRHRTELHPLRESTSDERRGDDGKHELVNHEGLMGDRRRIVRLWLQRHASQKQMLEIADEAGTGAKRQAVAAYRPEN